MQENIATIVLVILQNIPKNILEQENKINIKILIFLTKIDY
jgi:hypothetical protein